jgi:membrane protease subunit HflC
VVLVVLIVLASAAYTVPQWQQAIVVQLGEPVGDPVVQPGLHFKLPLIQTVYLFEKRVLEWDGDPEVVPTKDSKFIYVDTFARWRISDPLTFYKKVVNEAGAQTALDDVLDGLVRDTLSAHTLLEIVRSSDRHLELGEEALTDEETSAGEKAGGGFVSGLRDELTDQITREAKAKLEDLDLGIDVVDLQIKRLDYTDKVLQKVYDRMVSQQLRIAEKYRALGQGKKAEIAGQLTEESKRIQSEAYRKSQEILGEGDAISTRIYAEAYRRDLRFYTLVETLKTYEETLDEKGVLLLSTDSELYRYLKQLD